jgi:hypothetical protein
MSVAFLRRLFCGNLGGMDIKDAILENSSAWRDLTFGVADMKPPIPAFIIVTSSGDDESSICLDSDEEDDDDTAVWLLPELGLRKDFWGERKIENESSTDEDLFTDDEDDGSSYAPSPVRTWQSTTSSQSTSSSGAYNFDMDHPWFCDR